jgi:dTDP-4-amino-4,6-dideoxygalactose transaminase
VVVHLYGQPADLGAIGEVARRHGLTVVEDCAQAHGAIWRGRRVGSIGTVGAFSFYPTKNLGAFGDGGAVCTDDDAIARKVRSLREYGWEERYVSAVAGMNSRLDELHAAMLRIKLLHLDADNARRQAVAARYDAAVGAARLHGPSRVPDTAHVFHQFVIRSPRRDRLREFLQGRGVGTGIHYPVAVHQQPAYRQRVAAGPGGLAETERAAREVLSLPMFPQLAPEDVSRVTDALGEWGRLEGSGG